MGTSPNIVKLAEEGCKIGEEITTIELHKRAKKLGINKTSMWISLNAHSKHFELLGRVYVRKHPGNRVKLFRRIL